MPDDIKEALISKLYNGVIEIAEYTCVTLNKGTSTVELAENDPSFEEIAEICKNLVHGMGVYKNVDSRFSHGQELLGILNEIIEAIPNHDSSMLVDCTCHLEQYLELNVRPQPTAEAV